MRTIGLFSAAIFAFGLLSVIGYSNTNHKESHANQIESWQFNNEDSLKSMDTYHIGINLEKSLVSKYNLGVKYCIDRVSQTIVPVNASSSLSGFISGLNWRPTSVIVNRTNNKKQFEYFVNGVMKWNLLETTIYAQPKNYT